MAQGFDSTKPLFGSSITSSELRTQFNALATQHSGASPPASPQVGWNWLDTSIPANRKLKIYNGTSWVIWFLLDFPFVSSGEIIDQLTPEAVTRGNDFVQTLSAIPADPTKIKFFVNGGLMKYGEDYSVSVDVISWLITAEYDIESDDEIQVIYFE